MAEATKAITVIVDTCVISQLNSNSKKLSDNLALYLEDLSKRGYELTLSTITGYEILQNLFGEKEDKTVRLLDQYQQKEITTEVLYWAAKLRSLYKEIGHEITKKGGDSIIAATAFLLDGRVLTINCRDYPYPFFTQVEHKALEYEITRGDNDVWYTKTIDITLFRPDKVAIFKQFDASEKASYPKDKKKGK